MEGLSTLLGFHVINEMGLLLSSFLISYTLLKLSIDVQNKYGKRTNHLAREAVLSLFFFFLNPNRNNYIEIETALDLTKYLAEEDEIIVWHAVLLNLVTRDLIFEGKNHDIYPLLKVISCFIRQFGFFFFLILSSSFYISEGICEAGLSSK